MSALRRPSLTFLGGVGTVTGSKFLLETATSAVLIDCGLFQGLSSLRRRNWERPALPLDKLSAVVLTHAHLDHSGYLPALARSGWQGPVYCTEGTARLADIVLTDSAHLMQEEARLANEQGWSKHHPALPLYEPADVDRTRALFRPQPFGTEVDVAGNVRLTLGRAGHILGSAWARLDVSEPGRSHSMLSSGDLGRPSHPLLAPPDPRPEVDTLLLESTYGAREHGQEDAIARLSDVIRRTAARGGSVLIPAFAVDRTEILLKDLIVARKEGRIGDLPIVVDSPMALACLAVYRRAIEERWPEIRSDAVDSAALDPAHLLEVRTAEESARWNDPRQPAIVISASGMASGGRVLHHLRHMLPNRRHSIVVVGYAAEGTRARQLSDGASEIKIHGRYVPVRAEVIVLDSFSAHADARELQAWATAAPAPQTCYLVHGEPHAAEAMADRLRNEAAWTAVVPKQGERVLV